ncbi:hypothetical protein VSS37_03465 [Candidatus Thiothrix sp. Deng01]|uniref:Bacteriophage tail tape measure N-terminal domain-containing protein n=1 Tax=Candidatus Thiothrix phosphatis TaxID=3112415 RepID=A0ABU6CV70_9GAMM|nr:hypothetical protein [Candidatus Thiothrix sp. Deng01]MEB4590029.1 hypothetical protein [Candidatus Thiothrix sp. Deng01]
MSGSNLIIKLKLLLESDELQRGLDSGKTALKQFAAAAASAGTALGAVEATTSLLELNRELNILSQSMNITRDALQTWQIAGQSVGIEADKMSDIFKDVNDKLGDFASTGGGEAVDLIKRLKLNINDLIAMSPDQALLAIADAMEKTKDMSTAEKTFLLESLADDASRLLPLLEDGAAKLDAIKERASTNLVIITDEQKAILDEANAKMAEIGTSLDGLSHQAGTAGAMLINAFGDSFADAIDQSALLMQDLPDIAAQTMDDVAASWAYGAQDAGEELAAIAEFSEIYFGYVGQYAMQALDVTRMAFTYMPVYAKAGYDTAVAYSEMYLHSSSAMWEDFRAASNFAFAALLQYAKAGFVGMASAGSAAVAFLIDKLATFAQSAAATFSAMSDVPGFDAMANGAASVAGKLAGMADSARNAGGAVADAFDGAIANLKASGEAAQQSAAMHRQLAIEARDTGQAAIEAAGKFITQKEAQRAINAQIREENQELGGLANGLKTSGDAAKKFHVNQDAVNKALNGGASGAKAAKAAKSELEKQTDKLAKAYADELQNLQLKNKELTQTGEEYYRSTLEAKNFTQAMQDEAGALHYSNTLLDARKKLTQESNAVKLNPLEQYKADLKESGMTASDIAELATEKQAVIQAKITAELEKQRKKAELTKDEYAEWEVLQEGVTAEFARQAAASSKLTDEIEKQRKLAEELNDALVNAFVDAAESGFKSFDSLKDYFEKSFSDLVINPAVNGVFDDIKTGNNPWTGLQQQFSSMYSTMQAGGLQGASVAGGAAGYLSGLLGGNESQQIGATIGGAAGNYFAAALSVTGPVGAAIGALAGHFAGSLFKDDDSARAYFTGGNPTDGYAFTDRGKTLYASSALGTFGFQAHGTHDLGEQGENQLEAFVKKMAAIDDALAKFMPESEVQRIRNELQSYQKTGLDFDGLFKERLTIITSGLSIAMRGLIDYSQDADGIISQIDALITIQEQAVPALRDMGLQIGNTEDAALQAAAGLVEAAGGLQSLTSISATYYDAVYSEAEQKLIAIEKAREAVNAFNAANNAQVYSLSSLRAYIEGLDQSTAANRSAAIQAMQLADELKTLEALQFANTELGKSAVAAANDVSDLQDKLDFLQGIQDQLDEFDSNPTEVALRNIQRNFEKLTAEGQKLGASESELLAVRELADKQTAALASGLRNEIASLNSDLFGLDYTSQINSLKDLLQTENDRIAELQAAAQERYQQDLSNYEAMQALAGGIGDYLDSLKLSNLSTNTPVQLLEEAAQQYADTLRQAQAGDNEAAGKYQGSLQAYLQQAQSYYGNSNQYQEIFNQATAEAERLQAQLGNASKPIVPADIQSLVSRNLERQIELLEQQAEYERKQNIASEIKDKLAQLSLATGEDIDALANELGISLSSVEAAINGKPVAETAGKATGSSIATQIATGSTTAVASTATTGVRFQTQAALFNAVKSAGQSVNKIADIKDVPGLAKALGMTADELRKNLQFLAPWLAQQWESYGTGSDYITHDQQATVHKGEIIMTPTQSGSVRNNIVAAMQSLSRIQNTGTERDGILEELRGLRADNQKLATEVQALRVQVAQYSSIAEKQRDAQIAEITTQRRDNERKTAMRGRV